MTDVCFFGAKKKADIPPLYPINSSARKRKDKKAGIESPIAFAALRSITN